MRIAIVCYPTFGGSGVVATELGTALAQRGHEIHFITYRQPVRLSLLSPNIFFHEVYTPEYPLFHYQPYDLALSSKLVNVVTEHSIEVLHVHYAIPHAYAGFMAQQMLASKGYLLPMVTTLHGTDITLVGVHPFYKPAVEFSINQSDAVTSVSASLRDMTFQGFDIEKNIEVIPNFIDIDLVNTNFNECDRSMIAFPNERIVTHISNMRAVKRIPDVIKTFALIQKKVPAVLLMVGDGPEVETARALSRKLKLEHAIKFLGNTSDIDKILCFSDLFLLPSQSESFGLAALEAMSNRVAVISSNAGGIPEVNQHGVSGYLSEIGDVQDMAANAIQLLSDSEKLERFKNQAFQVAQQFSKNAVVPMYEQIYRKAYEAKTQKS